MPILTPVPEPPEYVSPLPDVDALLHEIFTAGGLRHVTQVGPDLYSRLPLVVSYRIGGAAPDPRRLDVATVFAQTWAAGKADAWHLAVSVRLALFDAWRSQAVYPSGVVNRFSEISAPSEIRGSEQPDNVWRYDATYRISVRPNI